MRLRTTGRAAICRISTRAGWERANCCGMGATLIARRSRAKFSRDTTAGRSIQRAPDDPKDQQGFAYPAYVVFLLAPTVDLPFDVVQKGFRWLLMGLAAATVFLWLYVLRWKPSCGTVLIFIVLMLGWLPMVQGIKLQQLSLLVAGLLAACGACLAGGWLFLAGGLLALATIKPQLTWPLVLWLLLWAGSDWRRVGRFVFGFGVAMLLLLGGAQLILPGWLRMFVDGIGQYHHYTQNQSVLMWTFRSHRGPDSGARAYGVRALCIWRAATKNRLPARNLDVRLRWYWR